MANYDDRYTREEKTHNGGKNLRKTAFTLATGAMLALGGKGAV